MRRHRPGAPGGATEAALRVAGVRALGRASEVPDGPDTGQVRRLLAGLWGGGRAGAATARGRGARASTSTGGHRRRPPASSAGSNASRARQDPRRVRRGGGRRRGARGPPRRRDAVRGDPRGRPGPPLAVTALIAPDLLGGILTTATNAAERCCHRPRPGARRARLLLAAALLPHLAVAALLPDGAAGWFPGNAGLLLAGALLVEFSPVPLRRPVAMGACTAAVLTGFLRLTVSPGLVWSGPPFFPKPLVCHLVPEAPLAGHPAGGGGSAPARPGAGEGGGPVPPSGSGGGGPGSRPGAGATGERGPRPRRPARRGGVRPGARRRLRPGPAAGWIAGGSGRVRIGPLGVAAMGRPGGAGGG
ncbi:hypothetical protein [Streptomyces omiyaensis]|uniref:hypothetical protein n=1 Tax=Streptomyces omiyaensis TaxID=68247 RepID=UPI001E5D8123|nr:hypothetical protein [Streptomyces omiyaensis]